MQYFFIPLMIFDLCMNQQFKGPILIISTLAWSLLATKKEQMYIPGLLFELPFL